MQRILEAWRAASEKCQLLARRARNEQPPESGAFLALERLRQAIEHQVVLPQRHGFKSAAEALRGARDAAVLLTIEARDEFPDDSLEYDILDDLMFAMIERVSLDPLSNGWRPADPPDAKPQRRFCADP